MLERLGRCTIWGFVTPQFYTMSFTPHRSLAYPTLIGYIEKGLVEIRSPVLPMESVSTEH